MTKTLIVSYLPRGERSHTRDILKAFEASITNSEVEHLDLLADVPDLFGAANLEAYVYRNYLGKELSAEQKAGLEKMDRMTKQLMSADIVVLAFPMHNFSFPASVKAWFDSVMQKGETWDMGAEGFAGKLSEKKAVVFMASGGIYEGEWVAFDHATTLAQAEFSFMGFAEVHIATINGTNMFPEKLDDLKLEARKNAVAIAKKLYT